MAQVRTALDHLLDARAALVDEVQRLAATLAELDSLIGTMGGQDRLAEAGDAAPATGAVNTAVKSASARTSAARAASRRPATRRTTARRAPAHTPAGEAPKSIRVHVLDMLGAEERDFGLTEIIDGVHDAGIPAHDDAVRSITIKLMKDGRVERVGRGQYRLARRGTASRSSSTAAAEPAADDAGSELSEGAAAEAPPTETLDYAPPLNLNEPWGAQQG